MAHADLDSTGRVVVHTAWNEKEVVSQVPGARWDALNKVWVIPSAWAALVTLRGVFQQQLTLSERLIAWVWELRRAWVDEALALRTQLDRPANAHDGHLYPFQRAGVAFAKVAGSGLLADEMGTGKSIQALTLIGETRGLPGLIICPNSVKHHWRKETARWLPGATPYVVEGTALQRRKILKAALADSTALVVVNVESVRLFSRLAPYGAVRLKRCRECDPRWGEENLSAARCEVHHKELNDFEFKTVILDEAHRIKEPKSLQTRAVWYVGHQASVQRRWALTGTPIANHPGDLWSVMHFVAPDDFPVRGKFVDRFCTPPDSQVWMADGTFKQIGAVLPGDLVMGFDKTPIIGKGKQPRYHATRVLSINRRSADLIRVHVSNGDVFLCTPDHRWLTGWRRRSGNSPRVMQFSEPIINMTLRSIVTVPPELPDELREDAAWLGGVYDGEGTHMRISQTQAANPDVYEHIGRVLDKLGLPYRAYDTGYLMLGGRDTYFKFVHWCRPIKRYLAGTDARYPYAKYLFEGTLGRGSDPTGRQTRASVARIIKIEDAGHGEVVSLTTETETYIVHGYASHNCLISWNAFGGTDVVGIRPDTRDELFKLLDPRFRRVLKAIVLPQLPPKIREVRYAELSTSQARMYRELENTLTTRTEAGELLIAPSNLAAQTRLLQLACASVSIEKPDENDVTTWKVTLREPSPKLDVLEEVLDELGLLTVGYDGPPVLIAAEFRQLIDLAAKRLEKLNVRHGLITGAVAEIDRERALEDLRARRIRALLFTSKAGGVGLDMSASDTLINLQRGWSLVDEKQKEDRPHRPGAEIHERIRIIDITTRGTVEETVIQRLHEKLQRLDEITRDRAALISANDGADVTALDAEEQRVLGTFVGVPTEELGK